MVDFAAVARQALAYAVMFSFAANSNLSASRAKLIAEIWLSIHLVVIKVLDHNIRLQIRHYGNLSS